MELYVNTNWTEWDEDSYIAEAIAWSENANHATIYCMGDTPEEAEAKLVGALRELKLLPEAPTKDGAQAKRAEAVSPGSSSSSYASGVPRSPYSLGNSVSGQTPSRLLGE
jgi:hypothetical protein